MARHLLVVEAYDRAGREELLSADRPIASDLYRTVLKEMVPDAWIDVLCVADPDAALPAGTAIGDYDGITWTGSSLTIWKEDPRVARQVEFAREAYRAGVPSFGSCWAIQIAAVAAGGTCRANPNGRELGVARRLLLTYAGRGHPFHAGRAPVFEALCSHLDEVESLPASAVVLSDKLSDTCPVSGHLARKGRILGGATASRVRFPRDRPDC